MSKHLYAIVDGEVHPFNCYKKYTEIDALVAYANTEEHAMELATMYEHGEIEPAAGVRNGWNPSGITGKWGIRHNGSPTHSTHYPCGDKLYKSNRTTSESDINGITKDNACKSANPLIRKAGLLTMS